MSAEATQTAQRRTEQRKTDWAEIAAAVVLSVAALATSWSGFQAELWGGEQATHYTEAGAARVAASHASTQAGQLEMADVLLFTQWLGAEGRGDERLAEFYHARFRPEFRPAFDAWLALHPLQNPQAPPTPFVMPQYRSAHAHEAAALMAKADKLFDTGQKANDIGDGFVQATVFLALALFFGGIGQTFRKPRVRLTLVTVAAIACVVGIGKMLMLPALHIH